MSKATNQALIDAIGNGQPNTAEEARLAWTALNNELYPSVYTTSWDSNIKTAQLETRCRYSFIFSKQGNRVTMYGRLFTTLGSVVANTDCFAFTDPSFNHLNNSSTIVKGIVLMGDIPFEITNGIFKNLESFSGTKYFCVTYSTND